jgi:hypothetical protein
MANMTITCPHCDETIYIEFSASGEATAQTSHTSQGKTAPGEVERIILSSININVEAPSDMELAQAKQERAAKIGKPILERPENGIMYFPQPKDSTDSFLEVGFWIFGVVVVSAIVLIGYKIYEESNWRFRRWK